MLPPALLGFPSLPNYNVVLKEEVCVCVCVCVCVSLTVVTKPFVVVECYYGNHD